MKRGYLFNLIIRSGNSGKILGTGDGKNSKRSMVSSIRSNDVGQRSIPTVGRTGVYGLFNNSFLILEKINADCYCVMSRLPMTNHQEFRLFRIKMVGE